MKCIDLLLLVPIALGIFAYWLGMRLNREERNRAERLLAAEDLAIYGTSFLRRDKDGTVHRVPPDEIYFDSEGS